MTKYYFEDFSVGDRWELGTWSVSREELIAFATEYDPQPIHIDEAFAADGPFEGLIVSGWQTTMNCARMFIDRVMSETAGLASPGIDEIRWLKPVRPDQAITATAEVFEVAPLRSRPDRGRVHVVFSGLDVAGEAVMTCRSVFFIARREPPAAC